MAFLAETVNSANELAMKITQQQLGVVAASFCDATSHETCRAEGRLANHDSYVFFS